MSQHSTFKKLVTSDDDFIGMVAYTIYKNDKINWIDSYTARTGNEPTFTDIQNSFNVTSDSDQKVQQYLSLAEAKLNTFVDQTITVELEQYKREILNTFADPKIQELIDNKLKVSVVSALTPVISNQVNTVSTVAQRIETKVNPLDGKLDKFKPTFWNGVWQNMAATAVTAIIVAIVSTCFWFWKYAQNEQKKEALKEEMQKEYGITDEEWNRIVKIAEDDEKNPPA